MQLALISPSDDAWLQALADLPHDVYHLPQYVQLEAERMHGRAAAVSITAPGFRFFLPLVLAPLDNAVTPGAPAWDATSPYGYPAPIFSADSSDTLLGEAIDHMLAELSAANVASLFVRSNPLLPLPAAPMAGRGLLLTHGQTVWINLAQSREQRWSEIRPRFRSYLNRLERLGLHASEDPALHHLDRFMALYRQTMDKVGAADWYYFSRDYLAALLERLHEHCSLCVVTAPGGEVVSAGIFTVTGDIAQYHLSGTQADGDYRDALKLLIEFGAIWAGRRGATRLHLGGGVGGEGDKLFQFKAGFSRQRSEFSSWRVICNRALFEAALARSPAAGLDVADKACLSGFFPPYRSL